MLHFRKRSFTPLLRIHQIIRLAEPSRLKTRLNPARHRIDHLDDFSSKKSKTRIAPSVS